MDPSFKEMCEFFCPKFTPEVMKGYVTHEVKSQTPGFETFDNKGIEERVDATLRKAWDKLLGGRLVYHGFERCTPQEEYEFATRPKNTKRIFELAPSDIYLIKIKLSYYITPEKLEPLPDVFMYLPNPQQDAGLMRIGGPLYQLIPIVSDKVISPEGEYLFVRLEQYKMKFFMDIKQYPVVVNEVRDHHDIYWANIYKQKQGSRKSVVTKAQSCLGHYLFARLSVTGTFQKFAGFTPIIGTDADITEKNYPPDSWVIVRTAYDKADRIIPPTRYGRYYKPTNIRMAIPKQYWNATTKPLVFSFFYVVDAFSEDFDAASIDNTFVWKLILGKIISDPNFSLDKIIKVVEEHFSSTDTYMDDLSIEKLAEKKLHVSDFTDLLGLICTRFMELYKDGGKVDIIYGKYLDTLREVLYPITCEIYNTKYMLLKLAASKDNNLPYNSVKDAFIRKFRPKRIFALTSKGIVAESVSYSGDHMYLKITSRLSQQESTPGTRSSKGRSVLNSNHYLNTSMMMAGNILFLSKKKPVPMSHVNPFISLDLTNGTILERPEFKEVLKRVDEDLSLKN